MRWYGDCSLYQCIFHSSIPSTKCFARYPLETKDCRNTEFMLYVVASGGMTGLITFVGFSGGMTGLMTFVGSSGGIIGFGVCAISSAMVFTPYTVNY